MLQGIIETKVINNFTFWALENGTVGTSVFVDLVDGEVDSVKAFESAYVKFFTSLSQKAICRVYFRSEMKKEADDGHARAEVFEELGWVENRLIISVELVRDSFSNLISAMKSVAKRSRQGSKQRPSLEPSAYELLSALDFNILVSAGLSVTPLRESQLDFLSHRVLNHHILRLPAGLDFGTSMMGLLKLCKPSNNSINPFTLTHIKDSIGLPFEIRISLRKVSSQRAEMLLRKKTNQATSGQGGLIAATKYQEAQEKLEEVSLYGAGLFDMEYFILLPRATEKEVRQAAEETIQKLKILGDFVFETVGAVNCYCSSSIGNPQHVATIEMDRNLPSFIPLFSFGDRSSKKIKTSRSLALYRQDESLTYVDPFNDSYDNYSAVILGLSGRGKSVLTNLLTRSLLHDKDVRIIKVDVGGSHSKETLALGGVEYKLSLMEPSGINPFEHFSTTENVDVIKIVSSFLNTLLLEEGEVFLSKQMRGDIEQALRQFADSHPKNPTLDDFVKFKPDIPRIDLLKRWTGTGIYKNAFQKIPGDERNLGNRLRYYNFGQIFQASDPDFAQGGMAAVMAQFNLELSTTGTESKIVFIADETPFFILRLFDFFKLSTANVRKFGGSFITIAQKSRDLIVNGDAGIIENSASRYLFSVDDERSTFEERFKLPPGSASKIENLETVKGDYSDFLYCDKLGERVLRLKLTLDEYWQVTSSHNDNVKLSRLLKAVPELTKQEAIRCLKYLPKSILAFSLVSFTSTFFTSLNSHGILDFLGNQAKDVSESAAVVVGVSEILETIDESNYLVQDLENLTQKINKLDQDANVVYEQDEELKELAKGPRLNHETMSSNLRYTSQFLRRAKNLLKTVGVLSPQAATATNTAEVAITQNEMLKLQQQQLIFMQDQELLKLKKELREEKQHKEFVKNERKERLKRFYGK